MQYKENVFIEAFKKSLEGKTYRDVTFRVGKKRIQVLDIVTDTDESAYQEAQKLLKKAIEL